MWGVCYQKCSQKVWNSTRYKVLFKEATLTLNPGWIPKAKYVVLGRAQRGRKQILLRKREVFLSPASHCWSLCLGFVLYKVALEEVFLRVRRFCPVTIISPMPPYTWKDMTYLFFYLLQMGFHSVAVVVRLVQK
jgi:hypothetical protein